MLIIIFFIGLIGLYTFGFRTLYRGSARWRYRTAVRAWLVAFALELLGLSLVNDQYVPQLGLTVRNGFRYMVDLLVNGPETVDRLVHGQYPDMVLLLALPLLPALVGFWYDRRRQAPS